jgi:hypothetical protein
MKHAHALLFVFSPQASLDNHLVDLLFADRRCGDITGKKATAKKAAAGRLCWNDGVWVRAGT